MTILNNFVSKLSNAGTCNKRTKVGEEIKNFKNLTVNSDDDANKIQEFEEILMNDIEEGEIDFTNSNLHEWSAGSKDFDLKLNSDNKQEWYASLDQSINSKL